ncbi:hypothetical protein ACFORL_06285 [Legionella dresdenensis]|uniref:HEAT repeat domain-containing protein n=1 Tax=Legionella dresdenensis TaxID=450200 RepID=A0ABV8CET6_9GAMM
MKKKIMIIMGALFTLNAQADNIVDFHGDKQQSSVIMSKYAKDVSTSTRALYELLRNNFNNSDKAFEKQIEPLLQKRFALVEAIKKEGNYSFVDFQTVFYPNDKNIYTTIEVIKANDSSRLKFVNAAVKQPEKKQPKRKKDLIDQRIEFDNYEMQLMQQGKIKPGKYECPVYHCVTGYAEPRFKPYLAKFNTGAVRQKKLILDTLNHDPVPERRAAAAFMVGHFTTPDAVFAALLPHVNDSDEGVRNNVMRVIGSTMDKAQKYDLDLTPFINMLNSPYGSDRNKALYVLLYATHYEPNKKIIARQAGAKLIDLLALKQPNNHDTAYQVLKEISGEHFSDQDITGWKKWMAKQINSA